MKDTLPLKSGTLIGMIRCEECAESHFEIFLTKRTLGAICTNCAKVVFDTHDLQSFINESILKQNLTREEEDAISLIN